MSVEQRNYKNVDKSKLVMTKKNPRFWKERINENTLFVVGLHWDGDLLLVKKNRSEINCDWLLPRREFKTEISSECFIVSSWCNKLVTGSVIYTRNPILAERRNAICPATTVWRLRHNKIYRNIGNQEALMKQLSFCSSRLSASDTRNISEVVAIVFLMEIVLRRKRKTESIRWHVGYECHWT